MEKLIEKIVENAGKEFNRFRSNELAKEKEAIFDNNYEIRFYSEIYVFLNEGDMLSNFEENELRLIAREGDGFIGLLYDYYLHSEYASISNWEAVTDLIRWYCEKYAD